MNAEPPRISTPRAALLACALLASCTSDIGTAVHLEIDYPAEWGLTDITIAARDLEASAKAEHEYMLLVPDAWATSTVTFAVSGFRDGEKWAFSRKDVMPIAGEVVVATMSLERISTELACGDWCTDGQTRCEGGGVITCTNTDSDACHEWSTPIPCVDPTPACSFGKCRDVCSNECSAGELRCDGPRGVMRCDTVDGCSRWVASETCADGGCCVAGVCKATCENACTRGDKQCVERGVSVCGDADGDTYTEWSPVTRCAENETCTNGACVPVEECTNECVAAFCDGMTYKQCGEFDDDACLDASAGTSCIPSDPCMEGRCTERGCAETPKVCAPKANECIENNTKLREYTGTPACDAGACQYAYTDRACANCPACDDSCPSGQHRCADACVSNTELANTRSPVAE